MVYSPITESVPVSHSDPVNAQILDVSEDRLQGFIRDPVREISRLSGVEAPVVIERIRAMLKAGTIRRVRQTLVSTNLAPGALVAWRVPVERIDEIFDWMFQKDPFSGHVVVRSTDSETAGSQYRLWTTLKVPDGYSMEKHCRLLLEKTGATAFRLMPAKMIFALGVGHVRRKKIEPGSKAEVPAEPLKVEFVRLSPLEWRVLMALKREFEPEEIDENLWQARAREAGISLEEFCKVADGLNLKKVIGRFSTFLEHVKPLQDGDRVTKFNALFHWAVPPGRELEAGREVGRHHIMTHCYWREGGPEFKNVNIMGVAHGTEKPMVHKHKAAIDEHLKAIGMPVAYTNIFWGGRSEIKPSEIAPAEYEKWCESIGADPAAMRDA
jgi:DNA-binding Lrp family transcriptional regulator